MLFNLIEGTAERAKITPELIAEFREADDKRRETIVHLVLNQLSDGSDLKPMINSFRKSCYQYGIDPTKNPFIEFIPSFVGFLGANAKYDKYMSEIVDLVVNGTIPKERLEEISNA